MFGYALVLFDVVHDLDRFGRLEDLPLLSLLPFHVQLVQFVKEPIIHVRFSEQLLDLELDVLLQLRLRANRVATFFLRLLERLLFLFFPSLVGEDCLHLRLAANARLELEEDVIFGKHPLVRRFDYDYMRVLDDSFTPVLFRFRIDLGVDHFKVLLLVVVVAEG